MCMCIMPLRLCECASIDCVRSSGFEAFELLRVSVYAWLYRSSIFVFVFICLLRILCTLSSFFSLYCSLAFSYSVLDVFRWVESTSFIYFFFKFFSLFRFDFEREKCCCSEPHSLVFMLMLMFMFWLQFTHTHTCRHAILRNSASLERFYLHAALNTYAWFRRNLSCNSASLCTT